MVIPELKPLLEKVELLRSYPSAYEVLVYVEDAVHRANTPAMAQSACAHVISMCNPKAWGDFYVEGFGSKWTDWHAFLSELSEIAAECGQKIYDHSKREKR